MAPKIVMNSRSNLPLREVYEEFVFSRKVQGCTETTVQNYKDRIHNVSKYLDIDMQLCNLTKRHLEEMICKMRDAGLAHNTIASYVRSLRTFLLWCSKEGLTNVIIPQIKERETVKQTYSDEELELLLKRPKPTCEFGEFRDWVIINFLMNCGCRASTVRNIQIQDVDLERRQIVFRHNKNGRVQTVPLCSSMVTILNEYMRIRRGKMDDYLFCDIYGGMLTENALRLAIVHYNRRRGVQMTSIHAFRHTFAKKYLIDCGGNAFTLQRLLGHSTLEMTKRYCAVFDADAAKNFDTFSPLEHLKREQIKKHK